MAIVNVFIGNADAHGKNFSLLYTLEGPRLAPFYDLMSTAYYPTLASSFAMKIGDQGTFERMGILAWKTFASACGLTYPYVRRRIQDLAKGIPKACERTLGRLAGTGLEGATLSQLADLVGQRTEQTLSQLSSAEGD